MDTVNDMVTNAALELICVDSELREGLPTGGWDQEDFEEGRKDEQQWSIPSTLI